MHLKTPALENIIVCMIMTKGVIGSLLLRTKMQKYIKFRLNKFFLRVIIWQRFKETLRPILSRIYFWSKLIFLLSFPFIVAISLWTTIGMCTIVLFEVLTTGNKTDVIGSILNDINFLQFSYFPVSYIIFFIILWYSKDLWPYADKIYSSQIQQLYFLISILAALILLSIDRVWS